MSKSVRDTQMEYGVQPECVLLDPALEHEIADFEGHREAVGMLNPTHDRREGVCTGGEKRRHLRPRFVQKVVECKTLLRV